MIPLIHLRNIDSMSPDAAESILSHMHWASHTTSTSTSFRSDLPSFGLLNSFNKSNPSPPDHKKTDDKPMGEFLWHGVCCHIGIKDSSPKQESFYEYTWKIVAYMMITRKGHSSPNIWSEIPRQSISIENIILRIWYKKVIKQTELIPSNII